MEIAVSNSVLIENKTPDTRSKTWRNGMLSSQLGRIDYMILTCARFLTCALHSTFKNTLTLWNYMELCYKVPSIAARISVENVAQETGNPRKTFNT